MDDRTASGVHEANLHLMRQAEMVYVATLAEAEYPFMRCMFNLRNATQYPDFAPLYRDHDDDMLVYLGTNASSVKVGQMRDHAGVSLYYCLPAGFHGMMLCGKAEDISDTGIRETLWQEGWERYYPQGPGDPDYCVLLVRPVLARGWYQGRSFEYSLPA